MSEDGRGRSYKAIWQVENFLVIPKDETREILARAIGAEPDEIDWEYTTTLEMAIIQTRKLARRIRPLLPDEKLVAALTREIERAEKRAS